MQAALKEDGIPVQVVYRPYNERYTLLEGLKDLFNGDIPLWANTLNHVAQFGIVTGNAYNEFYTVGSTSKGLITTMTTDHSIASYANFADFVNNRFGDLPNGNIHGIYKDFYSKDHGSYYVGSECLNGINRDHQFIIAGLNLINNVELYSHEAALAHSAVQSSRSWVLFLKADLWFRMNMVKPCSLFRQVLHRRLPIKQPQR